MVTKDDIESVRRFKGLIEGSINDCIKDCLKVGVEVPSVSVSINYSRFMDGNVAAIYLNVDIDTKF